MNNVAGILALLTVGGSLVISALALLFEVAKVIGYYFGSSEGSARKTELLSSKPGTGGGQSWNVG